MSSSLAGKFQDHYEVLGVNPRSDSETIQDAYQRLAKEFHPDNRLTGNKEKFDAVNAAFEVLADPMLRREFDKVKGVNPEDSGSPTFSGLSFFESLGRETKLRSALLCVLYDRKRKNPFKSSLSMRDVETMFEATNEELFLAIWYLKQKSLVASDDKSSLQITVEGMDHIEAHPPTPEIVMPLIKASALAEKPATAQAPKREINIPKTFSARPPSVVSVKK